MFETFGEMLRRMRRDKNIGQRELADKLGIAPAYLCDVEKGFRSPFNRNRLEEICQILQLSESDRAALYDAAARSSGPESAPADIVDYIMSHDALRELIRERTKNDTSDSYWKELVSGK